MSPSEELGYLKRTIREAVIRLRYTSDTPEAVAEYLEDSLTEVVARAGIVGSSPVEVAVESRCECERARLNG